MATAPVLPTALATGDIVSDDWVDKVRALLAWQRDDRPLLKVGHSQAITTGTTTAIDFSDGSGNFSTSPTVNVDSWAAASGGNEGVIVPRDGLYVVTLLVEWATGASANQTKVDITDGGTAITGGTATGGTRSNTAIEKGDEVTMLHYLTDGDELGADVTHQSGSNRTAQAWLIAEWICSGVS